MEIQIDKSLEKLQPYPVNENLSIARLNAKKFSKIIKENNTENKDVNIFVRGSSGIIIGTFICIDSPTWQMKVVRKSSSHSSYPSMYGNNYNVIVDDFIESGDTVVDIYMETNKWVDEFDLCVVTGGIFPSAFDNVTKNTSIKKLVCGKILS